MMSRCRAVGSAAGVAIAGYLAVAGCGENFAGFAPGTAGVGGEATSQGGGGAGAGGGTAGSGGVPCAPEKCPGADTDCRARACDEGQSCGFSDAASGAPCDDGATSAAKVCDGAGQCVECNGPDDCESKVCQAALCVPASCTDQVQNGDETDVDCGGSCGPCQSGKGCGAGADCESGFCKDGTCAPCDADDQCPAEAFCDAGSCKPDLKVGEGCERPAQCGSSHCADGYCCDQACEGLCEACSGLKTGKPFGTCAPIPQGTDPDDECALAPAQCGGDFCSGKTGACGPAPALTECRAKAGPCDVVESCDGMNKSCPVNAFEAKGTDVDGECGFAKVCDANHQCGSMHTWSKGFGSSTWEAPRHVAIGTGGDIVIGGYFNGSMSLGGGTLFPSGNDGFLARYDAGGNHKWSKALGSDKLDYLYGLATDPVGGDTVVTGLFQTYTDWGLGFLNAVGSFDAVIARFFSTGVPKWTNSYGASGGSTYLVDVALDPAGNASVAGYFWTKTYLGGATFDSAGQSDAIVARYDKDGQHIWSKKLGSTGADYGIAVVADGAGNTIVAGYFAGTVDFGGGALSAQGTSDVFLAKYGPNGQHLWSKRFGGSNTDQARALALTSTGELALGVLFYGTTDLGGGPLASAGGADVALALYDKDGNHQWSRRMGGPGNEQLNSVEVDTDGSVLVTGYLDGSVDFGGGTLTTAGSYDVVVAKYSKAGAHLWSKRFGGTGYDSGYGATPAGGGAFVLLAGYTGSVDFGGGGLPGFGSIDIALAKYGP